MMETENIYHNAELKNDSSSFNRDLSKEDISINKDANDFHKLSLMQTEAKSQNHRRSRLLVLITVCLGIICVLLVVGIIVQHNTLSTDRDLMKMSYMNIAEEYNETLSSLKVNYSHLTEERDQLQNSFNSMSQKNLELETELKKQQNSFNSMSQKKLELETELKKQQNSFNSMSQKKLELENELKKLQNSFNSMSQKNLELETELKKRDSLRGWYFISSEQKSWSDSRKFCRDHGSDLVIINSEEEQRFITSFIKEHVWIGLSDIENEGIMKWVDGTPLNKGFWLKGEPNNLGDEDCVEILFPLQPENNWNDRPCTEQRKWICEK